MNISNSDMVAFHKCEWRWFYERYKNLSPRGGLPIPMEVGLFGHTLMEEAFKTVMDGGSYEDVVQATGKLMIDVIGEPEKMNIYRHVLAFVSWAEEQGWKPVSIEQKGSYQVSEEMGFGFTPDIVFEFTQGPLRGSQFIVDYKFTGQYWTDREINSSVQVPKYIAYKNKRDGTKIMRRAVVMLNTRATAKDTGPRLFLVKWVPITKKRLEHIVNENEHMMERIYDYATQDEDTLRQLLVHTTDSKQCKMCIFADDLCPMDIDGRDTTRVLKANYVQNTHYGYNGETEGVSGEDSGK